MAKRPGPHSLFIAKIGPERLVERYGLSPARLSMWRERGIPWPYRADLAAVVGPDVAAGKYELPPNFLTPPELVEGRD